MKDLRFTIKAVVDVDSAATLYTIYACLEAMQEHGVAEVINIEQIEPDTQLPKIN